VSQGVAGCRFPATGCRISLKGVVLARNKCKFSVTLVVVVRANGNNLNASGQRLVVVFFQLLQVHDI
jgi:hypothetical protein